MKVIAIGDLHDSPHIKDKSRFRWIGKHIAKTKPAYVVQIGDFLTLDSCTYFIPDDTFTARIEKPTFIKDMQSFDEAMEKIKMFFEHFQALPTWFTNLWILVVASIFGIKGTQIFKNHTKK